MVFLCELDAVDENTPVTPIPAVVAPTGPTVEPVAAAAVTAVEIESVPAAPPHNPNLKRWTYRNLSEMIRPNTLSPTTNRIHWSHPRRRQPSLGLLALPGRMRVLTVTCAGWRCAHRLAARRAGT